MASSTPTGSITIRSLLDAVRTAARVRIWRSLYNSCSTPSVRSFGRLSTASRISPSVPRFGSTGIRGVGNVDVTPDLALRVGMILGDLYGDTIIGPDPRVTSPMLVQALGGGAILKAAGPAKVRVVSAAPCAATATIPPLLPRQMRCGVLAINAQADAHFPGREPEPTEENLGILAPTVRAGKADLGIAREGDGDRMVAVDREGRFVGGDALLALFARQEVRRGLVVPVDASMVLEDLLPSAKVWRTRVGDVYVAAELKRRRAEFGGEPSGTWIFPKSTFCPDGVYAAARLVAMVALRPLDVMVAEVPRYPVIRGSIPFDPSRRAAIEPRLDAALRSIGAEVTTVDGWRLQFDDGWSLVRFSGTEPKIRVMTESRDTARANEIYSTVLSSAKGAAE